ncbi:MAG: hypothetical protein HN855_03615 [Anaerolineae bacterium]|jgi:hypothetical protein|nr:hypothetical protein [Anaerolineae bacterium]MBT7070330.1 hypothetical protein [Anaerolineae bacterium]MBT7324224.1 hypothetical protein [Anaerolineae bacterium]
MFKKNICLVILILAVGLSACGSLPEAVQNLDLGGEVAQAQAPDAQAPQGQAPDSQAPQAQADGQQGQRPQKDLATVASTLGVTEEALQSALGEPGQGKSDFAANR